ncbi:WAG22 antigen precursor, putative [Trichomonas vaginalis G3]|uniref:receptor protein-tyrosine kinase n=1 Tax=Trichomonas vaginalis (strain ATCC PRA-98 / G3) TaxID=412133 RepID=A2DA90_TRIV3|nr:glycine-rich protein family [Trichomonas vaginalis G3]EAY22738.1 WAG22 antigen precursor, putative [Trichomonas vaginalis G3]KAI5525549.1 glycine-rich protein family [Trichomonas vaginalis G3]|eukprot:XP_001583724.1 WAG22 antigen precursor [Trichomonas vaginalis G3]
MIKGGYGGGGSAANWYPSPIIYGAGSGGGQTAVKFEKNTLWHRVIVSGGGGGSDNYYETDLIGKMDDGSGGAGGGFSGQGFWIDGEYVSTKLATSSSGFTFGNGESAQRYGSKNEKGFKPEKGDSDRPGAGAGWFGGFAGHHGNGGAGGGSSSALSSDAYIPEDLITAYDNNYEEFESHYYEFNKQSGYLFQNVVSYPGVWEGNGKLVITVLKQEYYNYIISGCKLKAYSNNYICQLGFGSVYLINLIMYLGFF